MNEERDGSDIKALLKWVEKELVFVKDELKSMKYSPSTSKVKERLTELKRDKVNLEYVIKKLKKRQSIS